MSPFWALAVLDDAAFGAATEIVPRFSSKKLDPHRETARMVLEPWLVEAALAQLPNTQSGRSADHREGHSYTSQGAMAGVVERTSLGRLTCPGPASRGPVSISTPLSAQCPARGCRHFLVGTKPGVPGRSVMFGG